jgi:hypothetical protein
MSIILLENLSLQLTFFASSSGACAGDEWTGSAALALALTSEAASRFVVTDLQRREDGCGMDIDYIDSASSAAVDSAVRLGEVLAANFRFSMNLTHHPNILSHCHSGVRHCRAKTQAFTFLCVFH